MESEPRPRPRACTFDNGIRGGPGWRAAAPARAPPGAGPAAPGRGGLCSLQGPYDRSATFWGRHDRRWPKAGPEALAVAEQRAARLQSGLPAPLGQTVSPAHAMASAYKGHVQRSTPRFRRGRAPSAMGFALLDSTRSRPGVVHDCQNACGQHRVRFGQRGCNARPARKQTKCEIELCPIAVFSV